MQRKRPVHPASSPSAKDPTGPHRSRGASGWRHVLRRAAAGLVVVLAAGCAVQPLPPITDPPSGRRDPGRIIWYELFTPDAGQVEPFYRALLGWRFDPVGTYYHLIRLGERPIGGVVRVADEHTQGRWIPVLSVRDADAAAERATRAGGRVLEGPRALERRGRFALVADPEGAQMLLLASASGDPPETTPALNGWLWTELWSEDPEVAQRFYETLAGYRTLRIPRGAGRPDYRIFLRDGHWRAGLTELPAEGAEPQWIPVVRVADPHATAQRGRALGGRILFDPGRLPAGGDTVVIADPAGAPLLLERWPHPTPATGGKP